MKNFNNPNAFRFRPQRRAARNALGRAITSVAAPAAFTTGQAAAQADSPTSTPPSPSSSSDGGGTVVVGDPATGAIPIIVGHYTVGSAPTVA